MIYNHYICNKFKILKRRVTSLYKNINLSFCISFFMKKGNDSLGIVFDPFLYEVNSGHP